MYVVTVYILYFSLGHSNWYTGFYSPPHIPNLKYHQVHVIAITHLHILINAN